MDWAIKAARKKTQRKPGSTRSIIETLDDLNNLTTDAHSEINQRLYESSEWLRNNVYMNTLKYEDKKMEESLISPENTHNKMDVEFPKMKGEYELSNSQNDAAKDVAKTPRNGLHNDKSITPKSLRRKEVTEGMNRFSIHDTNKSPVEPLNSVKVDANESEKSSPWSPYKVEKVLRESSKTSESPINTKRFDNQTWAAKEEMENEPILQALKKAESVKVKPPPNSGIARSQRRSNMFVPLPNKDPLIIQHIPPTKSSGSIPKVRTVKESPIAFKKKSTINSPAIRAVENSDTAGSTKASSVFDRLSSIPTKSFENKISRGNVGHKYSSSSIDLTGSPMKKVSQKFKSINSTDTDMQEALRDIFSVKNKITKNNSPKGKNSRKSSIPRFDKTSLKLTTHKKLAIIAEQKKKSKHSSDVHKTGSRPHSISPTKISVDSSSPSKEVKNYYQSPVRGYLRPTKASISPNKNKNLTTSQTPHRLKIKEKTLRKLSPNIADISKPESRKSKNYRLTNLQLLPPAEAERDDLKKKFDKRLSGIMRSQQEHHRRKQEKQKRMSHLEQDLKKQTSFSNDYKDIRLKESLAPFDNHVRDTINKNTAFSTDNILATINTVDHREIIGNVTPKIASVNDSLPEINTDSEDEASVTLAAWAKSPYLQEQLIRQQDINPQTIFGPIPPLHTDEIFPNPRLNRLKPRQIVPKRS
ncbi:BDM_1a_G0003900.mRNA.1.CDS.1 [Saccharomyces cerevisiae]|nr:BDM_1a_G0003900.mRNA.1.CDS.1 [Saccharomyces cerevisiae]CAI7048829.1 BDM_1a_G0003900.mRNA.1.CDS.1 [Saccharomyces cerevisiae]